MLKWCADSLDTSTHKVCKYACIKIDPNSPIQIQTPWYDMELFMEKALVVLCWMMSNAMEMRPNSYSALELRITTATMMKMLVFYAQVQYDYHIVPTNIIVLLYLNSKRRKRTKRRERTNGSYWITGTPRA